MIEAEFEGVASCRCGALQARCKGTPVRISVCHCLDCQRRSGSAFAAQVRFKDDQVVVTGEAREWTAVGDTGNSATFQFCPTCGSTVVYTNETMPGLIAVAIGAFGDPTFPKPWFSVWEKRKHAWAEILGEGVEHYD